MAQRTPDETVAQLLVDADTMTIKQLTKKYYIRGGTIRSILKRNNKKAAKNTTRCLKISEYAIRQLIEQGPMTITELAKATNSCAATVAKALKMYGITAERKPYTSNRLKQATKTFKILAAILQNPDKNISEISREIGCTREYVSQVSAMARQEGIIK